MKAYKNIGDQIGEAAFEIDNTRFYEAELTAEEEKAVNLGNLHNEYYVLYEWEFECHADNDGGIDAFNFGEKKHPLSPENSILKDGRVIGFFFNKRIFPLRDGAVAVVGGSSENVGGWGDISTDSSYTLKRVEK